MPATTLIAPGDLWLIGQSIPDVSLLAGSYLTGMVRNTSKPGLPALSNIEQRGKKELNQIIYSLLHEALFLVNFFFLLLSPVN